MTNPPEQLTAALADRYTIEREVGSGGMATVYLAEDIRHRRKVAVKVLRPELAAALGPERFVREIEIAAQLSHPHILPLYDSGEAGGFLYYVMPFVDGESLRDKLARERELPVPEAVRILRDVVDALDNAHAQAVVHRDIKPDNVMLSGRHALVTDFGVAKAVSEATGREGLTTAGMALGTPAYMAPEQASADPHIDHRADIYAVGALAYELLTGRPPFTATTPQAILAAHVTEPAEPVTKHRETVPPALESLVMRCLEKKPADRWQSAAELLQQLEALGTPNGGVTPTATRPAAAVRPIPRMRIGVAAALVAAVGIGAFAVLRGGGADDPRRSLIVFPFENQTGDPELDWLQSASVNGLVLNLAHWEDLRVYDEERTASLMRRRDVEPGDIDFEAARQMAQEADVGTLIIGEIRREADSLVFDAKVHDVSSGERIAREIVRSALEADHRLIFDSLGGLVLDLSGAPPGEHGRVLQRTTTSAAAYREYLSGMAELQRSDFNSAEAHLRRAIAIDSTFALGYMKLAWTLDWAVGDIAANDTARLNAVNAEQRRLIARAQRYSSALPPRYRRLLEYRAAFDQGRMAQARAIAEGLIQQDPTDVEAWYQLGEAHFHGGAFDFPHADTLGNLGRALRAFERTLALDSGYILAYMHTIDALIGCTGSLRGTLATARGGGWVCLADSAVYGSREELEQALGAAAIDDIARELEERQVLVAYGWVAALPQTLRAREELMRVLLDRKRYREAEQQLPTLRDMGSLAVSAYEAEIFLGSGRYHEAADRALEAIATAPTVTLLERMNWLTPALMSTGRFDEATDLVVEVFTAFAPDPVQVSSSPGGRQVPKTLLLQTILASRWLGGDAGQALDDPARVLEQVAAVIDSVEAALPGDTSEWVFIVSDFANSQTVALDTTLLGRVLSILPPDSGMVGRARMALARGDTGAATALREAAYDAFAARPIENAQMFADVFSWARVIAEMGDVRGALAAYDRLDGADPDLDGAAGIVRSWPERAALHQQLGETRQAIELYERFIDAWQDASPHVQPLVDRARAAVAALRGETAPER